MKTHTIAEAREKLPSLLKRAREGEDIGIISGNTIIQLRPVDVVAWENGYLFQEYGVTPDEWEGFKKGMVKRRTKEKYVAFNGPFDPRALE